MICTFLSRAFELSICSVNFRFFFHFSVWFGYGCVILQFVLAAYIDAIRLLGPGILIFLFYDVIRLLTFCLVASGEGVKRYTGKNKATFCVEEREEMVRARSARKFCAGTVSAYQDTRPPVTRGQAMIFHPWPSRWKLQRRLETSILQVGKISGAANFIYK